MSKLYVEDVYIEDLFEWFFNTIIRDGGDGSGAIVCKNYEEVSNWFVEWYKNEYDKDNFFLEKDIDLEHNVINFHDDNENFIFTNDQSIKLSPYEYVWIIKTECKFALTPPSDDRRMIPVEDYRNDQ